MNVLSCSWLMRVESVIHFFFNLFSSICCCCCFFFVASFQPPLTLHRLLSPSLYSTPCFLSILLPPSSLPLSVTPPPTPLFLFLASSLSLSSFLSPSPLLFFLSLSIPHPIFITPFVAIPPCLPLFFHPALSFVRLHRWHKITQKPATKSEKQPFVVSEMISQGYKFPFVNKKKALYEKNGHLVNLKIDYMRFIYDFNKNKNHSVHKNAI